MSKAYKIKISYKDLPGKVVQNLNIFDSKFAKYEDIKKFLIDKSKKNSEFKSIKVTDNDKFVLEIEGHEIPGLKEIFDETTYKYFYDSISENPPEKLRLFIVKVQDYPKWRPPGKSNKKPMEGASLSSTTLNSSSLNEEKFTDFNNCCSIAGAVSSSDIHAIGLGFLKSLFLIR